ncbi:MAG TPA: leucyl/phenylalanyl-tRNA--protein transferase [Phycisphaerae bacterium]|nr:leucyl/phenylalanyl-tRNA--protein transferase [Phycisphaerae bacterium]HNU46289.1 leucyl/phenylalanyl-tRNA--protein transferase [Phycisphaerae bacterium]
MSPELTPHFLLSAYACGLFPMGDEDGQVHWFSPDPRAIIEFDAVRTPRTLRSTIRKGTFEIKVNRAYAEVMAACADRAEGTWISPAIMTAYRALHALGFAHSVEAWQGERLVGGLYGVALGGAFFGESMFHRVPDASKVALLALVQRLRERGFVLLDVQFVTEHLARFGAREIPRRDYLRRLRHAVRLERSFTDEAGPTQVVETKPESA